MFKGILVPVIFAKDQEIQFQLKKENMKKNQIQSIQENYDFEIKMSNFFNILKKSSKCIFFENKILSVFQLFLFYGGSKKGKSFLINQISENTRITTDLVKSTNFPSLIITENKYGLFDMKGNDNINEFFEKQDYELLQKNQIAEIFNKENNKRRQEKMLEKKVTNHFFRTAFIEESQILFIIVGVLRLEEQILINKLNNNYPDIKKIVIHNLYQLDTEAQIIDKIQNDIESAFEVEKFSFETHINNSFHYYYKHKSQNNCFHIIFANSSNSELNLIYNLPIKDHIKTLIKNTNFQKNLKINDLKQRFLEKIELEYANYIKKNEKKFKKSKVKVQAKTSGIFLKGLDHKTFEKPSSFNETFEGDLIFKEMETKNAKEMNKFEYLIYFEKNTGNLINDYFKDVPFFVKIMIFCNKSIENFNFSKPKLTSFWKGNEKENCLIFDIEKLIRKKKKWIFKNKYKSLMKIKLFEKQSLVKLHFNEIFYQHNKNYTVEKYSEKDINNKIFTYIIPIDDIFKRKSEKINNKEKLLKKEMKFDGIINFNINKEKDGFIFNYNEIPQIIKLNYSYEFNEDEDLQKIVYHSCQNSESIQKNKKYKNIACIGSPLKDLILRNIDDYQNPSENDLIFYVMKEKEIQILECDGNSKPLLKNQIDGHRFLKENAFSYSVLKNKLNQEFAITFSELLIIFIDNLCEYDQENLYGIFDSLKNQTKTTKKVLVIHFFKNFTSHLDIELIIQTKFKKAFLLKNLLYDEKLIENSIPQNSDFNKVYYRQIYSNDLENKNLNVDHLILAENNTNAGNFYNKTTISYIWQIIGLVNPCEKDIFKEFEEFIKTKINEIFSLTFEEDDDQIDDQVAEKCFYQAFSKTMNIVHQNLSRNHLEFNNNSCEILKKKYKISYEYEIILVKNLNQKKFRLFLPLNKEYYQLECKFDQELVIQIKKKSFDPTNKIKANCLIENTTSFGEISINVKLMEKKEKFDKFVIIKKGWLEDCYEITIEYIHF